MIKIYRKIRQRLLTENRYNKYLLYAIGEIALVVIGILIAFQVNNQNNERIERNQILKNINPDLEKDIASLKYLIEFRKTR